MCSLSFGSYIGIAIVVWLFSNKADEEAIVKAVSDEFKKYR